MKEVVFLCMFLVVLGFLLIIIQLKIDKIKKLEKERKKREEKEEEYLKQWRNEREDRYKKQKEIKMEIQNESKEIKNNEITKSIINKKEKTLSKKEKILQSKIEISKKYLVIDLETNGLDSSCYDILEICIYRPDTNTFFHKYLPLTRHNEVFTTQYNGITKEMLKDAVHLTNEDMEILVNDFEINKRILLHYGQLDAPFFKKYLNKHKLPYRTSLVYYNFKQDIISSKFTNGQITKDNLCNALGIKGVLEVHDCKNDCILEWKLFKKLNMNNEKYCLILGDKIYRTSKKYRIPISLFYTHKKVKKLLDKALPCIKPIIKNQKTFKVSKKLYDFLESFNGSYKGLIFEFLLSIAFSAEYIDNVKYLKMNKLNLYYLGSLKEEENFTEILDKEFENYCKNNNIEVEELLREKKLNLLDLVLELKDIIEYVKTVVFKDKKIYTQEMVFDNEYNLLGLCDFSNEYSVMEVKSTDNNFSEYVYQLYFQSIGEVTEKTPFKHKKELILSGKPMRLCYLLNYCSSDRKIKVTLVGFEFYTDSSKYNKDMYWLYREKM